MRRSLAALTALAAATLAALAAGCTSPQPCPSPLEECSGECVDVQSDRRHCGACERSCAPGEACLGGVCDPDPTAACPARTGGAFVTLAVCGQAVKAWVERSEFVDEALAAAPGPARRVPVFGVRGGSDCDGQWSWHPNPVSARFEAAAPSAACVACPEQVQANVATYVALGASGWCPTGATILSVDVRPP
jgi:hypothetical protein